MQHPDWMNYRYSPEMMDNNNNNSNDGRTPCRPPPLSDESIDEWQQKISDDFNALYENMKYTQEVTVGYVGGSHLPATTSSPMRQCDAKTPPPPPPIEQTVNDDEDDDDDDRRRNDDDRIREQEVRKSMNTENDDRDADDDDIDDVLRDIEIHIDDTVMDERASPHQFDENEVNIHYKSPVQHLIKDDVLNDEELVKRQREQMKKYYAEEYERRARRDAQVNAQRQHHFTPTGDHVVNLNRYQRAYTVKDRGQYQTIRLARAMFDFHALSPRELSIKKGDIVIIHRPINHNWVEVEDSQSGLKGIVPRTYLDYEQEGVAKAKYDFDAKTGHEISLKKGDAVKLLRRIDNNWYEGINVKNEIGIFPCSYVETIKQPLALQLNNNVYGSPMSPPMTRSISPQYSRSLSPLRSASPRFHVNGVAVSRRQHEDHHRHATSPGSSKPKLYRVLYPYKPHQTDELELISGDILTVTMHCDDGWFVGHSTLTGQYGTFPGNYVEALI